MYNIYDICHIKITINSSNMHLIISLNNIFILIGIIIFLSILYISFTIYMLSIL